MSPAAETPTDSAQRTIELIVVHCTATPSGQRIGGGLGGRRRRCVDVIDHWHMQRGFARQPAAVARFNPELPHIGYHLVVDLDGMVYTGRSLAEVGAHVAGHNASSIGICLVGGAEPQARYTRQQWQSLARLHGMFARSLPRAQWVGHRDLLPEDAQGRTAKTCPGFEVRNWLAAVNAPPAAHLLPDGPRALVEASPFIAD